MLNMVRSGRLDAEAMATHRSTTSQMEEAYELFGNAAQHRAVKVVITAD